MAGTTEKPVLVLVHGAFHSPFHWKRLITPLRAAGYTVIAPPLVTSGPDDSVAHKTVSDDVQRMFEMTKSYLDAGRELVLVAHSYGGKPCTQFAGIHSVKQRERQGLKGGVKSLVYVCAMAPIKPGDSLGVAPVDRAAVFVPLPEQGILSLTDGATDRFYLADVPDERTRKELAKFLGFQSLASQSNEVVPSAPEIEVNKYYALCLRDDAILAPVQRAMAEKCGAEIMELDAGHSPFLVDEHNAKLVEFIGRAAGVN